ncbi:citrate-proton symporter [Asaia sp. W19]|uniref:MFS transporter n=1 Tax=unclassified Asaia TaxID=2685023 RepID=UPI000F8F8106|nr:MFS transporter [Asaia sp. W19]RUT24760.1 citrate-proton symporter [Asaia sp. W19]
MSTGQVSRVRLAKAIGQVASGNMLEMYDFMVFGYYAADIGRAFFPSGNAQAELMSSFATFGAGFLMRPLGALVLGAYVDRIGRRKGLILTLTLMAIGTMTLALTPGYETIGMLAPVLVLLGRLIQGFSAGVEVGSSSVYLSEIATDNNRGFIVAFQSASIQLAVVGAAAIGFGLTSWLGGPVMSAWGWRIPLFLGCLIVPVLLFLRRNLQETEAFESQTTHPDLREIVLSLIRNWYVGLIGILTGVMSTVSFYVITAYCPAFGSRILHLGRQDALLVTLCAGLANLILVPVFGYVSDRIGRKKLLVSATTLVICVAWPLMRWLVAAPDFGRLLTVELILAALYSAYNGAAIVWLTEIVPPRIRTTGFSLAYSLATCIGGFSPAVCTWLIEQTQDRAMPALWLSAAAFCGLVAAIVSRPYVERSPPSVK